MSTIKKQITDLLSTDSSRAVADMAVMAVGNDQAAFDVVFNLCINRSYPVNMRAARVLTLSSEKHPELIHPYLCKITGLIVSRTTGGVKRGLMKIIIDSVDINDIPDSGLLVDHCFKLIIDSEQEYAVRVYAKVIIMHETTKLYVRPALPKTAVIASAFFLWLNFKFISSFSYFYNILSYTLSINLG